ncbi:exodeoxyribonuclease VII large subunit [Pseudooceanicola aestuarii]|uniref:exodeoxyribonuclease VII large subunit n=1 Tax=Pseudooceanicola aestuarii TaxID=2697319 RepID=UPI0013D40014|nr:exodeoxyribonuclease VII large subunit [Pseudooceanicola aestuarii]
MFEDEAPQNAPEFSVTEISGAIKRVIEGEFSHIRVRGEIGRVSRPRSGHVYLDLKDDRSVLSGVIWKGVASRLETQPEEGLEVIATGRVTTFGGQSKYQIVIEDIRPAGMGALMAMLEKRKAQLQAEGLFDAARKRPLPFLPEVIGVVTSPSGAVIRDILHRLRDRFPRRVLIWPVAVQGRACAPEVARAIAGFNALTPGGAIPRPDLLIVARGGGSIEDLWGFNEEIVARAAANSEIPLISAVGHETDTTLIDFVSDHRAPTPTAAAELAVPVRAELMAWSADMGARLLRSQTRGLQLRGQRLRDLGRALPRPQGLTEGARQRLDLLGDRLPRALTGLVAQRRGQLSERSGALRPNVLLRHIRTDQRHLADWAGRLDPALDRAVTVKRDALARRADRLSLRELTRNVARRGTDHATLARRFAEVAQRGVAQRRDRLDAADRLRASLGYKATLERGYAVIRGAGGGEVFTDRDAAAEQPALRIEFAGDRLLNVVPQGGGEAAPMAAAPAGAGDPTPARTAATTSRPQPASKTAAKSARQKPPRGEDPDQGSLF